LNLRDILFNQSIIHVCRKFGHTVRLIVLHAGTGSEGLIDGCDLVFQAKSKDGDYHQEMNNFVFLEWFENQYIICAVIWGNPCFIQVHDIVPCFPKRFDLSQIITPIIDNRHLVVQNSSIVTYFFISISKINETYLDFDILIESFISLCIIETVVVSGMLKICKKVVCLF
jgi:hypothetical protein